MRGIWRVYSGKRRGVGVGEDGQTICERPDANTVDESEVKGRQFGRSCARMEDMDL